LKEEHAFFYSLLLLAGGQGVGQWLLLTAYSRGKADTGTSLLEYPRMKSAGCCRIPA